MMDIVERLRELDFIYYPDDAADISIEAADEIERLRGEHETVSKIVDGMTLHFVERGKEIERLREALKTFAEKVRETNDGIDENWAKTIYPLKAENQRLREALNADSQTIRLHLGEMTQQEMRTVKAAFAWVLSRAALKGE
jgi:hypothetical protein